MFHRSNVKEKAPEIFIKFSFKIGCYDITNLT